MTAQSTEVRSGIRVFRPILIRIRGQSLPTVFPTCQDLFRTVEEIKKFEPQPTSRVIVKNVSVFSNQKSLFQAYFPPILLGTRSWCLPTGFSPYQDLFRSVEKVQSYNQKLS